MNLVNPTAVKPHDPAADAANRELQGQRMEAIGRLAGGVAHDFNNLLTVITGCTHMLMEDDEVGEGARTVLQDIADAAGRAADLTRQLLAYSRRQTIRTEAVNVNECVLKAGKLLSRIIGEDIELVTELDPGAGSALLDLGQFDQVLLNLAVNARDAMPHGGRLTIRTENLGLRRAKAREGVVVQPGAYVRIIVTDTGAGMDQSTAAHIFEPFYSTKEAGRGTGLGLATVYGIVKQHGGFIFVDSQVGQGAIFEIIFPQVTAPEHCAPGIADTRPGGGSETVLLVEDEPSLRKMAADMLRREGYEVLEAQDGHHALQLLKQHRGAVDLVLTDIIMPRLGGPELARRSAAQFPGLPFVFTSGYIDESLGQSRSLASSTDFLPKPFTREGLARKVREVLDRPRRAA